MRTIGDSPRKVAVIPQSLEHPDRWGAGREVVKTREYGCADASRGIPEGVSARLRHPGPGLTCEPTTSQRNVPAAGWGW